MWCSVGHILAAVQIGGSIPTRSDHTKRAASNSFCNSSLEPFMARVHNQGLCDNQAVVAVVNLGYSQEPQVMHILRCLFFFSSQQDFALGYIASICQVLKTRSQMQCHVTTLLRSFLRSQMPAHSRPSSQFL